MPSDPPAPSPPSVSVLCFICYVFQSYCKEQLVFIAFLCPKKVKLKSVTPSPSSSSSVYPFMPADSMSSSVSTVKVSESLGSDLLLFQDPIEGKWGTVDLQGYNRRWKWSDWKERLLSWRELCQSCGRGGNKDVTVELDSRLHRVASL